MNLHQCYKENLNPNNTQYSNQHQHPHSYVFVRYERLIEVDSEKKNNLQALRGRQYNHNSDVYRWRAREPRIRRYFKCCVTGRELSYTDLDTYLYKRKEALDNFSKRFWDSYKAKEISLVSFVVDAKAYRNSIAMMDSIKNKFKRKNYRIHSYIWLRDIGKVNSNHYHLLMAIDRVRGKVIRDLFRTKVGVKFQFFRTKNGLIKYLDCKKAFVGKTGRNFGRSIIRKESSLKIVIPSITLKLNSKPFIYSRIIQATNKRIYTLVVPKRTKYFSNIFLTSTRSHNLIKQSG